MDFLLFTSLFFFGGWAGSRAARALRLPPVLGIVLFGIALGALMRDRVPSVVWEIGPELKTLALIVILLRAGLGLNTTALKKEGVSAALLTFVPCLFEGGALTVLFRYLFDFPWATAGLTAFMLAAVSPAVIVPSMLRFQSRGLGTKTGVPSLILAGASADDVFAITFFSIFLSFAGSQSVSVGRTLGFVPVTLAGGVLLGVLVGGGLAIWFRHRHRQIRATEKVLVLLAASMVLVWIGEALNLASLLGVMALGMVLLARSETAAHELSKKLEKVWLFAEILLFTLIGLSLEPEAAVRAGPKALAVIGCGLVFRSLGVLLATGVSSLTRKERLFCVMAYLPKATVQAALGSVALQNHLPQGETILAVAVLAILFTAPLGLALIEFFGPILLEEASDGNE